MTRKAAGNSLKAMLDRASSAEESPVAAAPLPEAYPVAAPRPRGRDRMATETAGGKPIKPTRIGTKMIGGHFPPEISMQLRMIAAEEDTTVQALLAEAIADLLIKKAGRKVTR